MECVRRPQPTIQTDMVYSIPCIFYWIHNNITNIVIWTLTHTHTHQFQTSSLKPVWSVCYRKLVGPGACREISSTREQNEMRAAQKIFLLRGWPEKFWGWNTMFWGLEMVVSDQSNRSVQGILGQSTQYYSRPTLVYQGESEGLHPTNW